VINVLEVDTMNIREALEARGFDKAVVAEAAENADNLRAAGYNEETIEALYESYAGANVVITGEFTLEKLNMAVDPDKAFTDFWEGVNA
jgi:hypothetical protein